MWKNENFTLTEKIFREINTLVKMLLSRIFCQKSVRVNFRHYHIVHCETRLNGDRVSMEADYGNLISLFILAKIDLTKYFLGEREFLVFPHCAPPIQCGNAGNSLSLKSFSSNQILFSTHNVRNTPISSRK